MPSQTRIVTPGPRDMTVRAEGGAILPIPPGWELLPPGDAGLTRRVKALGPTWTVEVERGRKRFSRGVWAPAEQIAKARRTVERTRATPEYAHRLEADRARRGRTQDAYVLDFTRHVEAFLAFHPVHAELGRVMAERIAAHATPVGSGTVARTARIPVAERAEAAVIAWLRHQTTAYDQMHIPRIQGMRREVRRKLAQRSRDLLTRYRRGEAADPECPLALALAKPPKAERVRATPTPRPARAPVVARPAAVASPSASRPPETVAPAPAVEPATARTVPTAPRAPLLQRSSDVPEDPREAKQRAVRERMLRRRGGG